ncbi:copper resistance CopC family protein [Streptomyces sp. NL15-2K]|uniref:copper resistance CopC family protein n=1 Tax=Streptomyces sp. NL15-2K TaxID=376149 RepID=UPI000F5636F0|nr:MULTISPECIES: copper resistance CopC family protein [Actinomycetes]WKX07470.1 copper resistance protein CopC [Kutzneria buriramensis]GCB51288.1 copper resistance protein D [Streptomyces sp. NL15-2K]
MYVTDRRAVRTAARALVVPAALAALAVAAPQAAAHTELDISSPAANAELAGLPPRVTLTFSDAMTQKYAKVAVTSPDGTSAASGEPQVSGKTLTLTLEPTSGAGQYTVGYRVVSADGHPVAGSYTFTVAEANSPSPSPRAEESAGAAAPPAAQESAPDKTDEESSGTTVPVLAGAGALAVAAAGGYAVRRRRAGHGH